MAALVFAGGCSGNKQAQSQDTVYINGFIYTVNPGQATAEALVLRADYATPNVTTSFTKIMLDGIPPTRTSAMLEPYLPNEEHGDSFTGKLIHSPEQLTEDMIYLDGGIRSGGL